MTSKQCTANNQYGLRCGRPAFEDGELCKSHLSMAAKGVPPTVSKLEPLFSDSPHEQELREQRWDEENRELERMRAKRKKQGKPAYSPEQDRLTRPTTDYRSPGPRPKPKPDPEGDPAWYSPHPLQQAHPDDETWREQALKRAAGPDPTGLESQNRPRQQRQP